MNVYMKMRPSKCCCNQRELSQTSTESKYHHWQYVETTDHSLKCKCVRNRNRIIAGLFAFLYQYFQFKAL